MCFPVTTAAVWFLFVDVVHAKISPRYIFDVSLLERDFWGGKGEVKS